MSFASPLWLIALSAVPVALAAHLYARRRTRRYAIRFPALNTLALAAGTQPAWRTWLPTALALAAIASLAVALARPQTRHRVALHRASVMIVTDHSGSMAANDVNPTRLIAAQRAADTFLGELPAGAAVGAVAFSSSPDGVQAPVTNHAAARAIIDAQTADGATATGDALQVALQLLHGGNPKHPPGAIVLLSDGAANAGIDAATIARQAGQDKIPIYTVALGSANATIPNPDPLGPPLSASPDYQLMAKIANVSHGRTFNAQSADQLISIYKSLGTQLGSTIRKHEITYQFAIGGLVLLLLAAAASTRCAGRLP